MPFLAAAVVACFLPAASPVVAQTLDRAEIAGMIQDETGAALGGVSVTLHETKTGFERTMVTGDDGRYSAPLMPLGVYVVQAERTGFSASTSEPLALTVGQALVVNVVMRVAGFTETLSISAPGNTAPALGTAFDANAVSSLPIDGRDYRDFALLSPTARSITGTRGTFRVAGQPGDYLALNVDGADFTNNFFGEFFGSLERQNFTIPLEAVQEFEVSAGDLGVQSGRSNGGLVNVVTKSGGNERHGSLAYSLRHHALTSDDAFGNAPVGLVRNIVSGSVGGPLVARRTFYFGAADVQRQTTPIAVKFARPVTGVAVPELGIADLGALEGQYPRHENVIAILAKIDHAITASQRLSIRGTFSRSYGNNIAGGATLLSQAPSNLETFHNQGVSIVTSLSSSVGPRLFLETKLQASRETRPRTPQSDLPQVQISDTGTFGSALFLPGTQDMYCYQVTENAVHVRGRHDIRFGADYNAFNMRNNSFALALNGAYVFPTLERFIARRPLLYAQNFGLNGYTAQEAALLSSFWQHEAALYVQDRIRPTPRLTIGMGLRYDMQVNPQPQAGIAGVQVPVGMPALTGNQVQLTYAPVPQGIPDDRNNWGPRTDLTYQLPGDGLTMVKGSAGLYYGRTPMIYFPLRGAGVSNTTLFAPASRFGVTFPEVLPSAIAPGSDLAALIGPPAISYVDPEFGNPRRYGKKVCMAAELPPEKTLDGLKKQAKQWLKALRAGHADARERFNRSHPRPSAAPGLRDVQRALARELGFASWARLKAALTEQARVAPDETGSALTSLLKAADRGDLVRLRQVLDAHPELIDERGELPGHTGRRTALHLGIKHAAVVRLLLERSANPNIRDDGDNAMPLHFAAESQDLEVIRLLIEHGADPVGEGTMHELDVLGWATAWDYVDARSDVVEYLLAHGASYSMPSAVALGAVDAIRELARRSPAELNRPMDATNHRRRPLHLAVVKKQAGSLATLLELNADPGQRDRAGLTPLDQAALAGEMALAQMLIDHGAKIDLPATVALGRTEDIERLLAEEPGCLAPGRRWGSLIIRAAERAPGHVLETLLRLGASPNATDEPATAVDETVGLTPLHVAAFKGNVEAIRILLAHGANPRLREQKYGSTAVGWAAYAGQHATRDLLLDAPIDIFDAIANDRRSRVEQILESDPGALDRTLGETEFSSQILHFLPLSKSTELAVVGPGGAVLARPRTIVGTAS